VFVLFCFVLLSYLVNVFSMCLVLSDVYLHVPYSDASDAETGSVERICMYVCMYECMYVQAGFSTFH